MKRDHGDNHEIEHPRGANADREHERAEIDAALIAVTPIDGRYRARTRSLAAYFSEFALIRYRVRVEIEWLAWMAQRGEFGAIPHDAETLRRLRAIASEFAIADARRVKELEAQTNHDVKAVEYFLKERIAALDLGVPVEMVHFACTSEDINNLAYALILKDFAGKELEPAIARLIGRIAAMARALKDVAMVARTHGQNATPTTMGKELAVFAARLERQRRLLAAQEYLGKFNGSVGNFNSHRVACPEVDWLDHSRGFVESLGLTWNPLTTQIESHDFIAEMLDTLTRIDSVMLDFARDMWGYVSLGYFAQRPVAGETGSSVMPHKVNPIDFENCEGNLGLASATFVHLAGKLPVSRWQRDLSDSTAIRGVGTAMGHLMVAIASAERGMGKLEIDEHRIAADLAADHAWEVLAEAVQTVMRRHGLEDPYERLKALTRGKAIGREQMAGFIAALDLPAEVKRELERLTPRGYVGLAAELVERYTPAGPNKR